MGSVQHSIGEMTANFTTWWKHTYIVPSNPPNIMRCKVEQWVLCHTCLLTSAFYKIHDVQSNVVVSQPTSHCGRPGSFQDKQRGINDGRSGAGPIPIAARSKAWFCVRSLAGIVGANPAGVWISVSCECCVMTGSSLRRADYSSRGVLPIVVCLSVILKPQRWGRPGPMGAVASWKKKWRWITSKKVRFPFPVTIPPSLHSLLLGGAGSACRLSYVHACHTHTHTRL